MKDVRDDDTKLARSGNRTLLAQESETRAGQAERLVFIRAKTDEE
jgi:hypothetical protein